MATAYEDGPKRDVETVLERHEPLMDAILQQHYDDIDGADTAYDDLELLEKADYLVGMVTGAVPVREMTGEDSVGVTYDVPERDGTPTKTEFSIPELAVWLEDTSGKPRTGAEPYEEIADIPDELSTGNEERMARAWANARVQGHAEEPKGTGGDNPNDPDNLDQQYGGVDASLGVMRLSAWGTFWVDQDAADPDPDVAEDGALPFDAW